MEPFDLVFAEVFELRVDQRGYQFIQGASSWEVGGKTSISHAGPKRPPLVERHASQELTSCG